MVVYISKSHKVIFSHLPKCGCESVRYLLLKEDGRFTQNKDIWGYKMKIYMIQKFHEYINEFSYITICRNPFERLVSGYIDKFCSPLFFQLPFCKRVMKYFGKSMSNPERISFVELVLYLCKNKVKDLDVHFRPQTLMIIPHQKNQIIKLEDKEKIDKTIKNLGYKTEFINYNRVILKQNYTKVDIEDVNVFEQKQPFFDELKKKNQVPKYHLFYNDVIKDMVYDLYKEDFIQFGYNADL